MIDKIDNLDRFVEDKYETKLTTDLKEILSLQQKQFLAPSSKVFSDTNSQLRQTKKS